MTIREYEEWKEQVRGVEREVGLVLTHIDRAMRAFERSEEARRELLDQLPELPVPDENHRLRANELLTGTNRLMAAAGDLGSIRQEARTAGDELYRFRLFLQSLPKTRD